MRSWKQFLCFLELWDLIEYIVSSKELELYDIELSSTNRQEDEKGAASFREKTAEGRERSQNRDREGRTKGSSRRAAFGTGGVVKVFLMKADSSESDLLPEDSKSSIGREGGVNVDNCASVFRSLSALDRFEANELLYFHIFSYTLPYPTV